MAAGLTAATAHPVCCLLDPAMSPAARSPTPITGRSCPHASSLTSPLKAGRDRGARGIGGGQRGRPIPAALLIDS